MKKFSFKLQRILDIRTRLEEEQKLKLLSVSSEYQHLVQKKKDILDKALVARQTVEDCIISKNISAVQLRMIDMMCSHADTLSRSLDVDIEKKRQKMEEEKSKYLKSRQDKRSLEILKEREWDKFKLYQQRNEEKTVDEITKRMFNDREH
ncbi:MAG: flagellar export protein FliJ [Brevinemataceae bacterium]